MPNALILSDGKPGHENQSKALAEGLGLTARILPCTYPSKMRKAASYLCDRVGCYPDLTGIDRAVREAVEAECPALLIGTGSNTFFSLKRLRRRTGIPCVAVLTPRGYSLSGFDAVVAPAFDLPPKSEKVFEVPTNLTPSRRAFYQAQTEAFRAQYTPKKSRAVGVIVGGKNALADVSPEWLRGQLEAIFACTPDCEHWVTTSRRTSPEAEEVVASFPFDYMLLFSKNTFNPIPAFVSCCERVFVTAESTGMLSEAVAIGESAVEVLDNLPADAGKFARFAEGLYAGGYAHRFDGTLGNAKKKVALEGLFAELRARFGLSCPEQAGKE